jgi:NADH-quinone oxidoreductase subunit M
LGFFVAFIVKLPAVPLHTWLPDAHTEASTAGSVVLAGLLLKTGGYGLLRFILPLFPSAAASFAPIAMILGVIGIIYGAVTAFGQRDLKRLVAYTSISHMGFVLLGVFAWNQLGIQGAIIAMLAHGISTGSLFILVGLIQERIHSRDMQVMGGFWRVAPTMGGVAMVFALASLGLPGLGNFVGEFLALVGTFAASPVMAVLGATGMAFSVVYSTWIMYRAFFGPQKLERLADLNAREGALLAAMIAVIVWLGVFPNPVLNTSEHTVRALQAGSGTVSVVLPAGVSTHGSAVRASQGIAGMVIEK